MGVADPSQQAAEDIADELGAEAHSSHTTLLDRIDAAVIATPTSTHCQVGLDLLSNGVHTLIEKPLAATTQQARELVDCAEAEGRVLQVGHVEQFNPAVQAVRQYIKQPKFIQARRYSAYTFRSTDIGVVMDVMIHDLDLILSWVGGTPQRLEGLGVSVMGHNEDVADVRIKFADGCVAQLTASRVSHVSVREMQIWCPDAAVTIDFAAPSASVVRPSDSLLDKLPDPTLMSAQEKRQSQDQLFNDYLNIEKIQPEPQNAIVEELIDFREAITTGRSPQVPGSAGLAVVACCEEILNSIADHAWDGRPDGRRGPFAAFQPDTIRPPHWHLGTDDKRRAG